MKIRKKSIVTILIAAMLIISVITTFGTSAAGRKEEKRDIPNTNFSEEEFDQLLALQFDGYEDMTVSEYQDKVWIWTDTAEYKNLLERFAQDDTLYGMKESNEIASFLFYTLEPLTAEKWQTRDFGGYTMTNYPDRSDNAMFEFILTLTIQNADLLTVRDYNDARLGMMKGLQDILKGKTEEQLQDDVFMQEAIQTEIENLTNKWNTDKLQTSVEYSYMPLTLSEYDTENSNFQSIPQGQEIREYPNGTDEDYRSLLALKTSNYQEMSIADFNMALLDWANENYERMERINCDISYQDFSVSLEQEELSFVTLTAYFSSTENAKYVQSNYTGKAEEDPSYNQYLPEKIEGKDGRSAWCDLFYQFSYHIPDKETVTVGERDHCIGGMINGIQQFWNETDIEDMLKMTEEDIVERLKEIAAEYSNSGITITVREDQVGFECMDERSID